jgi:hypothetical protein
MRISHAIFPGASFSSFVIRISYASKTNANVRRAIGSSCTSVRQAVIRFTDSAERHWLVTPRSCGAFTCGVVKKRKIK